MKKVWAWIKKYFALIWLGLITAFILFQRGSFWKGKASGSTIKGDKGELDEIRRERERVINEYEDTKLSVDEMRAQNDDQLEAIRRRRRELARRRQEINAELEAIREQKGQDQ